MLLIIFKIGYGQDFVSHKIKTVVIDAGHGGKDPGAIGSISREKDIALAVALKLGQLISVQNPDVKIVYTRVDDNFVELYQRANIANKAKADLFISLHLNSNKKKEPTGSEFYVLGLHRAEENLDVAKKENSVVNYEGNVTENYGFDPNSPEGNIIMTMKQSLFLDKSIQFAKACEKEFGKTETQYVRGTKQAGFVVLYQSSMPSCLVEIGFISNPAEEAFLNSNDGQTEIAQKLANAFKEFKFNYEDNSKKTINEPVAKKPTKLTANNAAQTPPEAISSITETPIEKIEPKKTVQEVAAPEKKPTLELSMEKIEPKKVEPEATVSSPNPTNTKIDPEKAVKKGKIDVDDTEDVYSYKPSKNSSINTENVVLYNKYSAIDTPTKPKEARTEVTQPKKTPLYIEDKKTNNATEASHKTEVAKSDVMKYPKDVPTLYKETVIEKKQIETPTIEFSNTAPVKTKTEIKKPEATEKPTPIEKPATNTKNELAYKIQVKASKGKINDINPSASLGKLEESYEDGLYKYLLGSFKTKEEAKAFLDRVKASGIADAFIVKYKNGVRVPLNVN